MSRRHHGNRPHRSSGPQRPTDPIRSGPDAPATAAANPSERASRPAPIVEPAAGSFPYSPNSADPIRPESGWPTPDHARDHLHTERSAGESTARPPAAAVPPIPADPGHGDGPVTDGQADGSTVDHEHRGPRPDQMTSAAMPGCTAPQLRRFIKSRPYVPMHELRRRFGINGSEDDVSTIDLGDRHRVYVGLPPREGSLLGELLRGGDIGYELSLDPRSPIVIGLYPMRPIARS